MISRLICRVAGHRWKGWMYIPAHMRRGTHHTHFSECRICHKARFRGMDTQPHLHPTHEETNE